MSNQIPDSWDTPAAPKPGISRVNSAPANALADALDARATALEGVAGTGTALAEKGKTDITSAAQGYSIGGDLIAAIEKAGTALDAGISRMATVAAADAKTVRTHVSGRQDIEGETEKKLDDSTAPEGTTYV